ncbi:hypothetical protein [Schleiferilactobacillus shenzhenensis]|uniref:Uncharacterized protein n=1 Tax=Schleiferilactobacillus shenzhenensis LY-73 TaxID=1231336 RepID=U4TWC8_9LACO|nr:hypothetical protein [Schleiferilactobacillus shenzhenensis]ERL65692.1 hypothetical protein L248_2378 [Schleiferilactobacillus shenzhenensis LY-73]
MVKLNEWDQVEALLVRALTANAGNVFWYDPEGEFAEKVARWQETTDFSVFISAAAVLFKTKVAVNSFEQARDSALIYCPYPKPLPTENFVTDCLYYSLELVTSEAAPLFRVAGHRLREADVVPLQLMGNKQVIDGPRVHLDFLVDAAHGAVRADHQVYFVDGNNNLISDKITVLSNLASTVVHVTAKIDDWDFESGEICYLVVEDLLTGMAVMVPFEVEAGDVDVFDGQFW